MSVNKFLETLPEEARGITAKVIKDDVSENSYILLEGPRGSLKFLADLIYHLLEDDKSDNIHLHPRGAGAAHFSPMSDIGIYVRKK